MGVMNCSRSDYLRVLLGLYWLRPGTAVLRTLDCLALAEVVFKAPILDLGCGDGLFSFTRAGGTVRPEYDVFWQAGSLDSFFANADIYDHFDENAVLPAPAKAPAYRIDVGFDAKPDLLAKAARLEFYGELVQGDANMTLPFPDRKFRTVFSNILYWIDDYRTTLAEIRRVLVADGIAVLHVPSETFRDYSFYARHYLRTRDARWRWLERLDRGRSESIKLCRSRAEWEDDFRAAGFKVIHHRRYLSRTVLEAWDIGLRPISPFLIEMANGLSPERRAAIKLKWIDGLMPMLEPLCELDWPTDAASPPGFHLFALGQA